MLCKRKLRVQEVKILVLGRNSAGRIKAQYLLAFYHGTLKRCHSIDIAETFETQAPYVTDDLFLNI